MFLERPDEIQQGSDSESASFIRMPSWHFCSPKKLDREWRLMKGNTKKPLFQRGTRVKRLRHATAHKDQNEDQWKRVLRNDESIIIIYILGPVVNNM